MIKRIDLFMPPKSQYQVLHHFTKELADALNRTGVRSRILEAEREQPKRFLDELFKDPPDCTLSFNGLLPDKEGRFFCDLVRIPHVACLVDSPNHFLELTKSKYSIVTCVDRFSCDFFLGLDFPNVLFMPHAVDKDLIAASPLNAKRPIDVLMLGSFIDYEAIREKWKAQFNSAIYKAVEEAAEMALADKSLSSAEALAQAFDKIVKTGQYVDLHQIDFLTLLDQVEDYISGKDRIALLKAIKDAKVHVVGAGGDKWKKSLGNRSNIIFQEPVSYDQAIELMKQSKIVLNSCPKIKRGAHERIFAGLACGALVITNQNTFVEEIFKPGESIVYYRSNHWEDVNEQINMYLSNEDKRKAIVEKGRTVIEKGHTWDHRAVQLIKELEPILQRLNPKK